MNHSLPTKRHLEKLTIRAMVAYAARIARRLIAELRGVVADDILNEAQKSIDEVWTSHHIEEVDKAKVICNAQRIAAAYAKAPPGIKSIARLRIVYAVVQAAITAMRAVLIFRDPRYARHNRQRAAGAAERTAWGINALGDETANAARDAARHDYDLLLRHYGQHDDVVIGDLIDCFEPGAKG